MLAGGPEGEATGYTGCLADLQVDLGERWAWTEEDQLKWIPYCVVRTVEDGLDAREVAEADVGFLA